MLIVSGTIAAGLVGFVAGVAAQPLPSIGLSGLLGVVAGAIVLDLAATRTRWLRPPAVGRQVPIEWGRMFPAPTVALLYGSRLGIGPMTILSTWLWWAATVGAALVGVGTSVAVGLTFGVVRLGSTAIASWLGDRRGHAAWFGRLRSATTGAWLGLDALAAVIGLTVIAA